MIDKVVLKDIIEKPITGEWGKEGNTVKVLRTTNFTNDGKIKFDNVVTRDIERNKTSDKKLIKGDIIIEKSGGSPTQPVGRVVYFEAEGEFLCNNFTAILRPKKEKVYPKFLFYLLFAYHKYGFTGSFQNKTTGIINLQLNSYINKTKIPLPPLEAQKRIAEILDAADTLRQKTKTLIERYDQLTQSLFLDMFGDFMTDRTNVTTLESLCGKGQYGSGASAIPFTANNFRYLRITDINDDGNLNKDVVSPNIVDKKYLLQVGDIVFARSGATVGKTYMYKKTDGDLIYAGYLIKFSIPRPYRPEYFFYFTKTKKYKFWIKNKQNVVAQPNINAKQYGQELEIPLPPLPLQNQFAERVQAIEEQKAKAQAALEKSEELFQSLLHRAFKGKLV